MPKIFATSKSGSSGAPTDATYITQTANATLSAEQALSSLTTGVVKVTNGTGVLSTAAAGTDYVAPGGALGTPSSGTLTNCGSLPISGLTASTSTALGVGSIELGHATDTTIARSGAGDITVEGNAVYRAGGTDVPVADGGTGASTAATALANLITGWDGWIASGETWTYAAADDPSFTFTVAADVTTKYQAGMRVKLTQTTAKYFIITAVSTFSGGNTTITIYGGTDYDLANAAITSPFYSMMKAPMGFPLDSTKWTAEASDTTVRAQATPVQNTWYNLGSLSLSIPIGVWDVQYSVVIQGNDASAGAFKKFVTLSSANNSESDVDFTVGTESSLPAGTAADGEYCSRRKFLVLTSKTSYYLNTRTTDGTLDNIYNRNDASKAIIRAVCAYL